MITPLLSVMTAFNFVSQEESHKSLSFRVGSDKSPIVFDANKTFKKSKAKNLHMKCTHCRGQCHLVEKCFKLVGYPEKHDVSKQKFNKFANNAEGVECVESEHNKTTVNSNVLTPYVIE